MPKIDIIQEAQERLEAPWIQDRENSEDGFKDLKFLAGDQWPNEVRLQREARNCPCLSIGRLPQFTGGNSPFAATSVAFLLGAAQG